MNGNLVFSVAVEVIYLFTVCYKCANYCASFVIVCCKAVNEEIEVIVLLVNLAQNGGCGAVDCKVRVNRLVCAQVVIFAWNCNQKTVSNV